MALLKPVQRFSALNATMASPYFTATLVFSPVPKLHVRVRKHEERCSVIYLSLVIALLFLGRHPLIRSLTQDAVGDFFLLFSTKSVAES